MKKVFFSFLMPSIIVAGTFLSCKKPPAAIRWPTNSCGSSRQQINAQLIPFATLSQGRYWMSVASAGNKIVFAGGHKTDSYWEPSSRVDIYDIIARTWTTAELSVPRYGMATVVADNKIFFAGGAIYDDADNWIYYSAVDIYDVSTSSWSIASLSEPRGYIAGATIGNKVFFAGGEKSSKIDIYDLSTKSWSTMLLSEPKSRASAVVVNNKMYIAGGFNIIGPSLKIDIFDNANNSWTTSSLAEARASMAAIVVSGKIYWAGGTSGYNSSCSVEIRDANTDGSSFVSLFKAAEWRSELGENAVSKDNKIVLLHQWPYTHGQYNPPEKYFDIYDINTGAWSSGALPASPITTNGSVISVNNTIYITSAWGYNAPAQVYKLEF